MLSIKRLIWIVLTAIFVSLIFLLINFQESTHEEVYIVNEQFEVTDLIRSEEEFQAQETFVLVTSDEENLIYLNLKEQMETWGKSFQTTSTLTAFDPGKEIVYIFCEDEVKKTTDLEALVTYVSEGGMVVFAGGIAEGNAETYLNPILGIANKAYKVTGSQFSFSEGFLPFQEDEMMYSGFNASTWVQLQDKAKIYVEDIENGEPVIYSYPYEKGKTLVVNASFLEDKNCLGILAGLLSNEIDGFIYPVYNTKLVFLDNFPVVTYVDDEVCLALYGRKTGDFVENVVWPVFQKVAVQDEIKFTSSVMTMGTGELFFPTLETALFYTMGRSALIYEGELIAAADFSSEGSLVTNQEFYEAFANFFPEYEFQALAISSGKKKVFDETQAEVIRGYMFGDEGSMFLCEPGFEEGAYQFPVITEGLTLDSGNLFTIAMQIASKGVVSQKIDINTLIADSDENPIWDSEKILFSAYEERVFDRLGWMESVTLSETANYINGYLNLVYDTDIADNKVQINSAAYLDGQAFIMNLPYEITDAVACEVENISGNYYLVTIQSDKAEILFDRTGE